MKTLKKVMVSILLIVLTTGTSIAQFITVSPNTATKGALSGKVDIYVNCTLPGTLVNVGASPGAWTSVSPASFIAPGWVTLTYLENPYQTSRSDDISFSSNQPAAMAVFKITQVGNYYPIPAFSANPLSGTDSVFVQFTDESMAIGIKNIISWEWDFGDGTTSNVQHPSHLYDSVGNYTVMLTVTDEDPLSNTEIKGDYISVELSSVGIKEKNFIEKVYPNPVVQNLFIETENNIEKVSIVNVLGEEVFYDENLEKSVQLNLNDLPSGMYFLRIYSQGILTTHKVLKR